jgi:hypothetical protein
MVYFLRAEQRDDYFEIMHRSSYMLAHFCFYTSVMGIFEGEYLLEELHYQHCRYVTFDITCTSHLEGAGAAQSIWLWTGWPKFNCWEGQRIFLSCLCFQTSFEAPLASYPVGTWVHSTGGQSVVGV